MSQSTPTKQSRHERHLMRQRGAGSRAINTNFDFTFGLATIAPVVTTPSEPALEPPNKRRRLSQGPAPGRELVLPETQQQPIETAKPAATKPVKKTTKARRRFPIDNGKAEITDQSVEDSFVAATKSRKPRAKRKPEEPVDLTSEDKNVRTSAKGRPRRQAAADAGTKVQNDLAEEAAPIDRKRRAEELLKGGRKGKKNAATVLANAEVVPGKGKDNTPETTAEAEPAPAKKTRATKTKAASRKRSKAAVSRPIDVPKSPQNLEAAAPLTAKSKPRAKSRVLELVVEHDHEALEAEKLSVEEAEPSKPSHRRQPAALKAPKAADGRKRKVVDAVRKESKPTAFDDQQQQQQCSIEPSAPAESIQKPPSKIEPLAEADGNVTWLSASPAKMEKSANGTGGAVKKPTAKRSGGAMESQSTDARRLKRRKLVVKADELSEDVSAEIAESAVDKHGLVEADAIITQKCDSGASRQNSEIANRRHEVDAEVVALDPVSSMAKKATKKSTKHRGRVETRNGDDPSEHEDASTTTEHETEPRKTTKQVLASQKLSKHTSKPLQKQEEDVDWLFAPHHPPTKYPKPLPSRATKNSTAARNRKRCSDLTDVDLDDLVANIAWLAPRRVKA
ncbi:hypothetical protein EJ03DRAFT_330765 [Teratosphaeria nubilosa]|uniref:Uncharacterized protein n=1 Tax=Teratosphaeria nubilosa TaxID=161662 RepID=A0A6G1KYD5_9PEZI|nr:hypothetical protein EJ03DRAFT_330765 [Teratosphaeria nubilosa]